MAKRKPDLYKRARGYGVMNEHFERQAMEENPNWQPVPGFTMYEVNELRQVRRITTKAPVRPYKYMLRPNEGEFVDFWISGQKHTISLDSIMVGAFKKEK